MHDLVIVGAGPVGATLAAALANTKLDVLVLDARERGATARGDRSLALSHGSRLVFERIGVWRALARAADAVAPIAEIDISQRGGFGAMRILAREANVPALGYVVAYRALQHALDERLAASDVRVEHETQALRLVRGPSAIEVHTTTRGEPRIVPARLVAIADGSGDLAPQFARHRHDYGQVALVAKAWMREPHHGIAFERFTPEGPMALLPEPDRYGVVWTTTPAHGTTLLDMSDVEFIRELTSRFGPRVPPFVHIAERRVFPLALEFAYRVAAERVVMLGNAAQSLHPVAGQGFNLGVRDAYGLARDLLCSEPNQFGTPAQLERYARSRRADRIAGAAFTHSILSIFGSASPVASWPRGALVAMLDATPVVKRMFTRSMLFGLK